MVINLTPEAKAKWSDAINVKTAVQKPRLLLEFYSIMLHHKGIKKIYFYCSSKKKR